MKKYTKSAIAILFAGSFALSSCYNSDADNSVDESVKIAKANEQIKSNEETGVSAACLYEDRKTEQVLTKEAGVIMRLNGETGEYVISIPRTQGRIAACNIPENMKVAGMSVIFSAELKEIYEYERWAARPSKLLNIVPGSGSTTESASE